MTPKTRHCKTIQQTQINNIKTTKKMEATFKINPAGFCTQLEELGKFIKPKQSFPIYECIKFDWKKGAEVILTAGSAAASIEKHIPSCTIDITTLKNEFKPFCINAYKLTEIVKSIPAAAEEAFIDVDENGNGAFAVRIKWNGGKFDIAAQSAEDYPAIVKPVAGAEKSTYMLVRLPRVLPHIKAARAFAAPEKDQRKVMASVLLEASKDNLNIVATDGRTLYLAKGITNGNESNGDIVPCIIPTSGEQQAESTTAVQAVIPREAADALSSLNYEGEAVSHVIADDSRMTITANYCNGALYTHITFALRVGNYPAYERVIPVSSPYYATFNKKSLVAALKRALIVASHDPNCLVKLEKTIEENAFTISANDFMTNQDTTQDIMAEDTNAPDNFAIGLSCAWLITAINAQPNADNITLQLSDPSRPVLMQSEDSAMDGSTTTTLLMPVRLVEQ